MKQWIVITAIIMLISIPGMAMTMHGYILKSVASDNKWIPGAHIRCSNSYNDYEATSGADGYYSIQGMEAGKYTCSVSASGYHSAIREVYLDPCYDQCNPDYKRVDFFLDPEPAEARIHGHVFMDGNPARAEVRCDDKIAESDSSGYYEMVLDPGTHFCTANTMNGKSILLSSGEDRTVNFFISSPTTTTSVNPNGRLYGYTYANGRKVSMRITCGSYSVLSNNAGYYSLTLPEGYYSCTASYIGYQTSFTINVAGNTRYDINIQYPVVIKHKLYGYVYGDTMLEGARVDCNGNVAYTHSGYYELVLDEGIYTCRFGHSGYETRSMEISLNADRRLDIRLQKTRRSFRLYGTATPSLVIDCNGPQHISVNANGVYSITMVEGYYTCRAHAYGYHDFNFNVNMDRDRRMDISLSPLCRYSFSVSGGRTAESNDENFQLYITDASTCEAWYDVSYDSDCDHVNVIPSRIYLRGETGRVYIHAKSSRPCTITAKVRSDGVVKTQTFRLIADRTPPEISVSTSCSPPMISVHASDSSGISSIEIYKDGSPVKSCHSSDCDARVSYGRASYTIEATDRNGNKAEKSISMNCCRTAKLDGYVYGMGRPINGAHIQCDGKSTTSSSTGWFELETQPGYEVCTITANGFRKKQISVNLNHNIQMTINLVPIPSQETEHRSTTSWTVIAHSVEAVANTTISEAESKSWYYYLRAVLWWIALILAIALLIFIILIILSKN